MSADWLQQAACVGDWDIFDSNDPLDHADAAAICEQCPVRLECAARAGELSRLAIDKRPVGTWAGTLYDTPQTIRRKASA